jgi:hypothetical protein
MKNLKILALFCASLGLLAAAPSQSTAATSAAKTAAAKTAVMRTAWPPETLSGKIDKVVPGSREIVVKDAGGVPFDLKVPRGTRILNGGRAIALKDLQRDQSVSVRFVPERRGDVARSIRIGG